MQTSDTMRSSKLLSAWKKIVSGGHPLLSIEITRECPLRCPGCYAYGDSHLGDAKTLRQLSDHKGQALVQGVLELVDRLKPLHVSLVGGDPLVRYRELQEIVPQILSRGIHLQLVTSAFRPLPIEWASFPHLNVVVSIDGLQPEHDARRAPATYQRILANIAEQRITIHCTITGQMMKRAGYLSEFLEFWTPRPEIRRVWFSLFTPQIGERLPEVLTRDERVRVIADLAELRPKFPKVDMPESVIRQFASPPSAPDECMFALLTRVLSADLKTEVTPCQFGGTPDCASCGCLASMGLAAVGERKLAGIVSIHSILKASVNVGRLAAKKKAPLRTATELRVLATHENRANPNSSLETTAR
jgi:MoaA/NifB/PqqE/SkfB family radical SAM enzyme